MSTLNLLHCALLASAASLPVYTKHNNSFCAGNFDADNHTFFESSDPLEQCESHCAKTNCACFDVRAASSAEAASCRLTNYSTAVRTSGDHFDAYTDQNRPPAPGPPGPPVSPGGLSRYGCVGDHSTQPFCNRSLPLQDRVRALVVLLTPEEKGKLLTARTTAQSNAIPRLGVPLFCWGQNSAQGYLQTAVPTRGGGITTFPRAPGMAATWNMSAVRRQGAVFATEARSIFNQGSVAGSKFSCPGSVVLWGPTINLNRDPRWGRNGETASEDPWFNSLYGAAYADGAQRPDAADLGGRKPAANVSYPLKTIVTLKHWGAYSVDAYKNATAEAHRQSFDANVSAFDMADSYAPNFEGAIRGVTGRPASTGGAKGAVDFMGALGVMCSYNAINGTPSCASKGMQTDTLRDVWGFQGYVVGDSDTVKFINTEHHYANSPAAATSAALTAGTDLESWTNGDGLDYYRDVVPVLLRNGSLPVELVDLALTRLFTLRFRAGLFDPPAPLSPTSSSPSPSLLSPASSSRLSQATDTGSTPAYFDIGPYDRGTEAFTADAVDAARQSMTLLRNAEGALPLKAGQRLLLLGPYADYGAAGNASSSGKISDELAQLNSASGNTTTIKGCAVSGSDTSGFAAATAAVRDADTVVMLLGCDGSKEHESMDRLDVVLPQIQSELALAVLAAADAENRRRRRQSRAQDQDQAGTAARGVKVVLVLVHYGEISTEELLGPPVGSGATASASASGAVGVDALMMAFMPHYGVPVAEALFGAFCVGGKLPYTVYPNNYTAGTDFLDMSLQAGEGRGYRFYSGKPLFEFGAGMSGCTSFNLTLLPPPPPVSISPGARPGASGPGKVIGSYEVQVTNTGHQFGTETVQLYVSPPPGLSWAAPLPKRRLIDFRKVALPPAAKQTLSFAITDNQLLLTDIDGSRKAAAGKFGLLFTNGNGATLRAELASPSMMHVKS